MEASTSSCGGTAAVGLEECLKLVRGAKDEQRLAGLLLATKLCKADDEASLLKLYEAVGLQFLRRLMRTGLGKGRGEVQEEDNREEYLQLGITVFAAFCRVADIASSKEIISEVPLVVEILSNDKLEPSVIEACYECLLSIASASEDGFSALHKSRAMEAISLHTNSLRDGSSSLEHVVRLLELVVNKLFAGSINVEYAAEFASVVVAISRHFALLHNQLKFDMLHLLSALLSSDHAAPLHEALRSRSNNGPWATYIAAGIVAILQSRVVSDEKQLALALADSMMAILGERWLLNPIHIPENQEQIPVDRCLLLVLEFSRIEVAVLLNELAYLKYEASKNTSTVESILLKQRTLATAYSLIERITKLISDEAEDAELNLSEATLMKAVAGLTETIGVVIDYLQDAKEHGHRKGNDLLASVRVIGSYLAETPFAFKEKFGELLDYILSVEGDTEASPFYTTCFLLPVLSQSTAEIGGCRTLVSCRGYKSVIACLMKLLGQNSQQVGDDMGTIFLACETIVNILLKGEDIRDELDESEFIQLLQALATSAVCRSDISIITVASSVCSLILDLTSEEKLLKLPVSYPPTHESLSQLIVKSLELYAQGEVVDDVNSELDLHEIIIAGYARWACRFPHIKEAVDRSPYLGHLKF
ncbi:neurochondrin [Amborella trichopoda]|uniref:neurochondrin n=1 Tax=Amborella trichopoda TaxID=13333 RepID=UPI0005D302B1|nr:neurochondrin [Amborella trichopoda]|eukprot:XP_011626379.1 neurochondrin [Amborella trichopoda]